MGPASNKMYHKSGRVLRIETTTNDVSFFKHHRNVEQRTARPFSSSLPSRKPSTASATCADSLPPPIVVTSNSSARWTIPRLAQRPSTRSADPNRTEAELARRQLLQLR